MKDILKMLSGGDFQSGVYAGGGSLQAHGIKEGDTFLSTISGTIQKVKDKNGKIVYINLSNGERDSQPPLPFKNGGALVGNQKRIDMNKNGKIDAEDFKLLRSSMNGAWRNERKHVNHNEDYEIRYARKKPSRTGYKGKRKFDDGGRVNKNIEISSTIQNFINKLKKQGIYNKGNEQKNVNEVLYRFDEYKLINPSSFMVTEFKKIVEKNYGVLSLSNGYDFRRINLENNKVIVADLPKFKGGHTNYINFRELVILNKNGGGVNVGYNVFNYTDNIYATDEVFKTKTLANKFIKEFRNRFTNQGYYRDNNMNKINIQDIDLLAIPSDFNPFRKMATGGGVSKSMQSKKMFFGGGVKKTSTLKKYENFEGKIVITKDEQVFKVISQDKDMVEVINPNLLGTGVRPTSINISEINKIV